MVQRRGRITDYRSVLARRGDVVIGAHARRIWWRRVGLTALGVLLILGAVWLYLTLRPGHHWGTHDGLMSVKIECQSCKWSGWADLPPDQVFPVECPKCGLQSCRRVWQCNRCGTEFAPLESGETLRCPNPDCRSQNVGAPERP